MLARVIPGYNYKLALSVRRRKPLDGFSRPSPSPNEEGIFVGRTAALVIRLQILGVFLFASQPNIPNLV
jgi:hypothetical protein